MARDIDLINIGQVPADIQGMQQAVTRLMGDFRSHTHDGVNSKQLENIVARTLQVQNAIIGGHRVYEAVVGPVGSDYKSVAMALKEGKTRIFVRNGTYTSEPQWLITNASTTIVGESKDGVSISFASSTDTFNIEIDAPDVIIDSMKLTAYEASGHTLIRLEDDAERVTLRNLTLRNKRGEHIDGSGITYSYAIVDNVRFDLTATLDIAEMIAINFLRYARISNCFFDMTGLTTTGIEFIYGASHSVFVGCIMWNDQNNVVCTIENSSSAYFIGCYVYLQEITVLSNFNGCIFYNNGNAPSAYFISMEGYGVKINDCRVWLDDSYDLMAVDAATVCVTNCWFDGGRKIYCHHATVTITGSLIANNSWTSGYSAAAIDLQVTSNCAYWNVLGNIIRCNNLGGSTPTLTDAGSSTNVANNQLYKA